MKNDACTKVIELKDILKDRQIRCNTMLFIAGRNIE